MGLFDFFKKKNDTSDTGPSLLFSSIYAYREYIRCFMNMQQNGNYAPIAAYQTQNGERVGYVYMNTDDTYTWSAAKVLEHMQTTLEKRLHEHTIQSYVVLYHSQFRNDGNHTLATTDDTLRAISIAYHFSNTLKGHLGLPYAFVNGSISYDAFQEFTPEQNDRLFGVELQKDKEYFQERVGIQSEVVENEVGIQVAKANTCSLSNTWGGILGFERFRNKDGEQIIQDYFGLTSQQNATFEKDPIRIFELPFGDVLFRMVVENRRAMTLIPVVQTTYSVDVETNFIREWEHVSDLEAVISGQGRNTFGVTYFATDYAQNREIYLSQKKLNIHLSGIVYVLDVYKKMELKNDFQVSDNFTAYFPNKDLASYGCFDFIGQVEKLRKIHILNDKSVNAYLMTVRLITKEDEKDFFTLDLYVNPENMRFKDLKEGMKVTGMFQMQGQIGS